MPNNTPYSGFSAFISNRPCIYPGALASEFLRIGKSPDKFLQKANSFVMRRGKAPSRGYFLMKAEDVKALDQQQALGSFSFTLTLNDAFGSVTIQKLGIVRAQSLAGMNVRVDQAIPYLVEIADARAIAHYSAVDEWYNARSYQYLKTTDAPDYFYDSTNSGALWTWEEMIQDLWGKLPSDIGAYSAALQAPDEYPENYIFRGMSAWDCLNKVLDDLSHTVVPQVDGSFRIVAKGADQGIVGNQVSLAQQGFVREDSWDYPECLSGMFLPSKVAVYFHSAYHAFQSITPDPDSRIVTGKDAFLTQPLVKKEITSTDILPGLEAPAGTVACLHDSLCAYHDEQGTILNDADLQTRAEQITELFLTAKKYQQDPELHATYLGFHTEILPGSEVSAVAWFDIGRGSRTEVLLSPVEAAEGDSLYGLGRKFVDDILAKETVASPDLSRNAEPTDRWAFVQVYGADIEPGGVGEAKVYYGTHTGGGAITWTLSTKIIALHNPWNAKLKQDDKVFAHWHLQTRRWISTLPRKPVLFKGELAGSMCPGEDGAPNGPLKDVDSCVEVSATVIKNPYNLAGIYGDKFVAFYDCELENYVALQVQHHHEAYVRADDLTHRAGCIEETDENGNPTGRVIPNGDCSVRYSKRKIAIMYCEDPTLDLTLIDPEAVDILVAWWVEGKTIKGRFQPGYVLCPCDYYDEVLHIGTDCATGSGSGSGG